MNISIKLNSVEIVDKVLSYTRTLDICSGIGTLELIAQYDNDFAVDPWDLVEVYEDGDKVGEFYVSMFDKSRDSGEKKVSCQDGSKKLVDWFIDQNYELRTPSYAKYWIELFLNAAGVPYTISALGSGGVLSENSSLGTTSAYDAIQGLLQMSGWYMYFNANGVCIIDTLSKDLSDALYTVTDPQIISVEIKKSDKDLRNRAVVWGNYSGGSWVFASRQVKTGYETSAYDWRTVVLANSTIYSAGTAASLAIKLLNEFANISIEKVVTLAGYHPVTIGDLLNVDSNYYTGVGLITNYQVIVDPSGGVRTVITLDVRCPRLFAYYGFITWVYTGTQGSGVYRKRLDSATWQDYSTGLAHYNVTDLMIKNSVFACIADGHCYVNLSHYIANWQIFSPGTLVDHNGVDFVFSTTKAVKVDIDETNNWISIGYELTDAAIATFGENRCWTVIIDPKRNIKATYPVIITTTGVTNLNLTDVEKYAGKDLVAVTTPSGVQDPTLDSFWGKREVKFFTATDPNSVTMTTDSDNITYSGSDVQYAGRYIDDTDSNYIANMVHGRTSYIFALNEFTQVVWSGDTKYQIDVPLAGIPAPGGADSLNSLACYWLNENDRNGSARNYDDREYYLLAMYGDGTNQNMTIKSFTPTLSGYPYELGNVVAVSVSNITLATLLTIDGVALNVNDRVLVTGQNDTTENGTYLAGMGAWSRTADTLARCATITVLGGTTYTDSVWQVANQIPITIGVSGITIQRVLIPTARVTGSQIIDINTDWGYGGTKNLQESANLIIPPRLVDGVYYFLYRGKNYIDDNNYTEEYHVYKYDCETNSTSNSLVYSWAGPGKRYNSTISTSRFLDEMSMPCDLGAAYTAIQYFQPGYDLTDPLAPVYNPGGYAMLVVIKASRLTNTYFTQQVDDPHHKGTAHGTTFDDYLYYWSSVNEYYVRHQGTRIINGRYHPYIKYVRSVLEYDDREALSTTTFTPGVDPAMRISVETKSFIIYDICDFSSISETYGLVTTSWDGNNIITTNVNGEIFESGDYGTVKPLYTKNLSYPVYLYNGNELRNGATSATVLTTFSNTSSVVSLSLDDFDDGIYRYFSAAPRKIIKQSLTGTTLATFLLSTAPPAATPVLTVSNGQIFLSAFTGSNEDIEQVSLDIYKLADAILHRPTSGASYILERNVSNTFDIIDTDTYALNLEASVDWPLISRTYGQKLGEGIGTPHFRLFTTYPNYIEGSGLLADARGFFAGGDVMEFETGNIDIQYNKYGLILNSGGSMQIVDSSSLTDGNTRYGVYTLSGTNLAIETSNHYFPNYMFISSENSFFQRNPVYNTTFLNHSSGMPMGSPINIIRLDDRV